MRKLLKGKGKKDIVLPKHVAIIVDGNRRWARERGLPDIAGHKYVVDHILDALIFYCLKLKIPYITFWVFSTENWKRGKRFASGIFNLMRRQMQKGVDKYDKAGVRFNTIGDLSKISHDLVKQIEKWKEKSKKNKKLMVTIALNYGGRDEIVRAINKILAKKQYNNITMKQFNNYLDTTGMPDPDLIIRTGGAQRLSGFLLWQCQYAEFYFTDILMPDFNVKEFDKALEEYSKRQRRFGK